MMAYEIWLSVMMDPNLLHMRWAHALLQMAVQLCGKQEECLLRGKLWCAHEDDVAGSADFGEQAGDAALQLAALLSARDEQA